MKLLFLCKRRPQGRDLLTRPYGRFYHLPRLLARQGHDVSILLCSYKREPDHDDLHDETGIRWYSVSLAKTDLFGYYRTARQLAGKIRPDWIIGFSDTYYGIMAHHFARRFRCKSLIDAYDNYESYLPWLFPLHIAWRMSLRRASLLTAAGPQLAELISAGRQIGSAVVPMAADPVGFIPRDRLLCREEMGLPKEGRFIGYCGSISHSRDIETLFRAVERLNKVGQKVRLVLSGRMDRKVNLPEGSIYLGYIADDKIPVLLNCMDVLAVMNRDSSFGNYSYPVKLYEAMSCRIPVVATRTASTAWILKGFPGALVEPGSAKDLADALAGELGRGRRDFGVTQGWEESCELFARLIEGAS